MRRFFRSEGVCAAISNRFISLSKESSFPKLSLLFCEAIFRIAVCMVNEASMGTIASGSSRLQPRLVGRDGEL